MRSSGSERLPDGTVSARYEFVHELYREVLYRRLASGAELSCISGSGSSWKLSSRIV